MDMDIYIYIYREKEREREREREREKDLPALGIAQYLRVTKLLYQKKCIVVTLLYLDKKKYM
jgi:hypothetical protein